VRILFVGMPDSVHVARWCNMLAGGGFDVHLFPVYEGPVHPAFRSLTVYSTQAPPPDAAAATERGVRVVSFGRWRPPRTALGRLLRRLRPRVADRVLFLAEVVQHARPDLVHTHEFQHGGYLTLPAKRHLGDGFPPWAITNWGSDISLFGRLDEHAPRIREVLAACDYYCCECVRDLALAERFGFRGALLPVVPIGGGFDLARCRALRADGPTSARRTVVLKGYQGWAGRALFGLRALALCADALAGYRVAIYLAGEDMRIAARLWSGETGVPVDLLPLLPHEEMLRLHGRARVSIGLSISDAISTSFLEALVMGSFPVQSATGCAGEWIENGRTGFLVHPEDVDGIAAAIRRALSDGGLVDEAARQNAATADRRLDYATVQARVVDLYRGIERRERARGRDADNRTDAAGAAGEDAAGLRERAP
jgi:glycosyltransferase involved in cell wall biosynthesis